MTIGNSQEVYDADLKPFFRTIPDSMFTCFRCFTGECVNQAGAPIHAILADKIGFGFVFGYVASFMLVSLGIFNVILAVWRPDEPESCDGRQSKLEKRKTLNRY